MLNSLPSRQTMTRHNHTHFKHDNNPPGRINLACRGSDSQSPISQVPCPYSAFLRWLGSGYLLLKGGLLLLDLLKLEESLPSLLQLLVFLLLLSSTALDPLGHAAASS
jgi:hypothetical protein